MKQIFTFLVLAMLAVPASAETWWVNGVLFGNVCRNGIYYTYYPGDGMPVGARCAIRDNFGNVIGWGRVSNE